MQWTLDTMLDEHKITDIKCELTLHLFPIDFTGGLTDEQIRSVPCSHLVWGGANLSPNILIDALVEDKDLKREFSSYMLKTFARLQLVYDSRK